MISTWRPGCVGYYLGSCPDDSNGVPRIWQRRAGKPDRMLSRTFASFAEAANYRERLLSGHVSAEPDDPAYRTNEGLS